MPRNGPSEIDVTVATQRRAQIVRAVMASIACDGLERTTMRNVAERAGVSTGTIAYYFKSKKEMVDTALLEASQQYMERFNREEGEGYWSLDELIDKFLKPDNADAGFVLQVIEVGLHNSELRGSHQWMVETGRKKIEDSIKLGMESGRFRDDLDPELAAAMLHGVLIWWGSEVMSNATSPDMARRVGLLALRLMETRSDLPSLDDDATVETSTANRIRSLLMADPLLARASATALADACESLYKAFQQKQ